MASSLPVSALPLVARVMTVEDLFLSGMFGPAPVQRDYQWRTEECSILLADLDRVFSASTLAITEDVGGTDSERELEAERVDDDLRVADLSDTPNNLDHYMLGAIVTTPPEDGVRLVYDGLQRMTTLTVLSAVLRDLSGDETMRERLDAIVRFDERRYRLTLGGKDTTLSRQVQPRGEAVRIRRGDAQSDMGGRIRVAAGVFREGVKGWDPARRDAFARFLLQQVRIVLIEARDPRLARQIFITTNLRGKSLNRVDLLKGQLVDIAADEDMARQVVAHWNGARNACGDHFEELLVAVDFMERRQPQGDDCLNALAEHVAAKRGPTGIGPWIQRLTHHAGAWRELRGILESDPTSEFMADIWRLQLFRWSNWQPLALLWFADYRRAERQGGPGAPQKIAAAQRRFATLHRRCMAVALAGFSGSDRERIFGRAISQVNRDMNPLASTGALSFNPAQTARIRETLRLPLMEKELRVTLIRWLTATDTQVPQPAHVWSTTVEHILPRRPEDGSQWTADFTEPDERFLACNSLGNLAGIDKDRNERLRNADFSSKKEVYRAAADSYDMLRDVVEASAWTPREIEARTERWAVETERRLDLPAPFLGPTGGSRA